MAEPVIYEDVGPPIEVIERQPPPVARREAIMRDHMDTENLAKLWGSVVQYSADPRLTRFVRALPLIVVSPNQQDPYALIMCLSNIPISAGKYNEYVSPFDTCRQFLVSDNYKDSPSSASMSEIWTQCCLATLFHLHLSAEKPIYLTFLAPTATVEGSSMSVTLLALMSS